MMKEINSDISCVPILTKISSCSIFKKNYTRSLNKIKTCFLLIKFIVEKYKSREM